jgi:hypothetical protein
MQPYLYRDAMHNFEQLLFLVDAGKLEAGL